MKPFVVVWFKRDLRIYDHLPLRCAAETKFPVLPVYIIEPTYWCQPDTDARQWQCINGGLHDLSQYLITINLGLRVFRGSALALFRRLSRHGLLQAVYSHQETGNDWTYRRDLALASFFKQQGIAWHQSPAFAVKRGTIDRDDWIEHWREYMYQSLVVAPSMVIAYGKAHLRALAKPLLADKQESHILCPLMQRRIAVLRLKHFLKRGVDHYQANISQPQHAAVHGSRLSVYLSYGMLSMREVVHATVATRRQIYSDPTLDVSQRKHRYKNLKSFESRLYWHCHFIQKLETSPEIEYRAMLKSADQLRSQSIDNARFKAFESGATGFPFVDACMRYLTRYGWINFRMRAMLTSFATCLLWLDWRLVAHLLASRFSDYEPGIHYPQIQMQSGITGINAIRIYNPVKQGLDQDPDGDFIVSQLPQLTELTADCRHQPWLCGSVPEDYPAPIIDYVAAYQHAKDILFGLRKDPEVKAQAQAVFLKHGSRLKRSNRSRRSRSDGKLSK